MLHSSLPFRGPPPQPTTTSSSRPPSTLILRKCKRSAPASDTSDSESSSNRRSKRQNTRGSTQKSQNQQTQTFVEKIHCTEANNDPIPDTSSTFISTCFPCNPIERWMCDPQPNMPNKKNDCLWGRKMWWWQFSLKFYWETQKTLYV